MSKGFKKNSANIVVLFVLIAFIFSGLPQVNRADDSTPTPMADWTIGGVETINGAIHYQDGNVTIQNGGVLNIIDGGLVFTQDTDHIYYFMIEAGGTLNMYNSILSTELNELYNYPKLDFTVDGGAFNALDSTLIFPGTFIVANNANVILSGTTITGFSDDDIDYWIGDNSGGINKGIEDDNNDAPIMLFDGSNVEIYDSSINKIYENCYSPNLNAPLPDYRYDITLTGSTTLTVVNSYVGVDFTPYAYAAEPASSCGFVLATGESQHNTILANDTSLIYAYNMTVDDVEAPSLNVDSSERAPALMPWGPVVSNTWSADVTAFGPTHTAGGNPSDLWADDNVRVPVAPGETLYADEFSVPPGFLLTGAELWVVYSTDAGYDGTNPVRWALDGAALQPTAITPIDTGAVANETSGTYDLFAQGVDIFPEVETLDIAFTHNGLAAANVYFELIRINLTYIFVDSNAIFYLYRWLDLTVTDEYNVPANNADVSAYIVPSGPYAYYPDNASAQVPPANILNYLGKTDANFNVTDNAGSVLIPLLTEWIDRTNGIGTMPNSEFIGNYRISVAYLNATELPPTMYYGGQSISFDPYPAISSVNNTIELNIQISAVQIPRPDLSQNDCIYSPPIVYEGDVVSISANVTNIGDSPALDVLVSFYEGPILLDNITVPIINDGSYNVTPPIIWNGTTVGPHIINIKADPLNTVSEKDETNNDKGCSILVEPNRPNLYIDSANISFSANPVPNNVVYISAQVSNIGRENATNVLVYFYVDENVNGIAEGAVDNSSIIVLIIGGEFNVTTVGWVPPINKTYEVCVDVDPLNVIVEDDETDNFACNVLVVNPAPNLYVSEFDIIFDDPYPKQGDNVNISAEIWNVGYADSATTFDVEFFADGISIGTTSVIGGLVAGTSVIIPAVPIQWPADVYGNHIINVAVDSADVEYNESNENDNVASRDVFVYRHPETWWVNNSQTYYVDLNVSKNIVIGGSGSLTMVNSELFIDQNESNMHVIKVLGGSLVLNNAVLTSNYPLVVYVTGGGTFKTDSEVLLSTPDDEGLIYADGNSVLILNNTLVNASIRATCQMVMINNSTLFGSSIYIETQGTSYIWDTVFGGVAILQLETDDANPSTVDFDLRNLTFNQVLTRQLRFDGDQNITLVNVSTYITPGKDWYDGMLNDNARIYRYWWLRARNVDGTGSLIGTPPANPSYLLIQHYEFNVANQNYVWVTEFTGNTITGEVLWPAISEIRYAVPAPHSTDNTYHVEGSVTLGAIIYYPYMQKNVTVDQNIIVDLVYPQLLPDLRVAFIEFYGMDNNYSADSTEQPKNREVRVEATIINDGLVSSPDSDVYFYGESLMLYDDGSGYIDAIEAQSRAFNIFDGVSIPSLTPGLPFVAAVNYTPLSDVTISVFVDLMDLITESDETDNENEKKFTYIYDWPDYAVIGISVNPSPVNNTPTQIIASILNTGIGYGSGTNAEVTFLDNTTGGPPLGSITLGALNPGDTVETNIWWTPTLAGWHDLYVVVSPSAATKENKDYNLDNNDRLESIDVKTQPDLVITAIDVPSFDVFENTSFQINVTVDNLGEATAIGFNVSVYYDEVNATKMIGQYINITLPQGPPFTMPIECAGIPAGTRTLYVFADSDLNVFESDEDNNIDTQSIDIQSITGTIDIAYPRPGDQLVVGATIYVEGWANSTQTPSGHLQEITIRIRLIDANGNQVQQKTDTTTLAGYFNIEFPIPEAVATGSYDICALTDYGDVDPVCVPVTLTGAPGEFPWWIILLIIIIIVVLIVAAVLYLRYKGLGKMVECGECGALIPEGSKKCPKCGVEFEEATVKCSNCGAWIPAEVKSCPECGTEFVVGEVKAEEYREKMRKQYDEVVNKYKEKAKKDLGATFTEAQFQAWWQKQPTFITFELWLKEEEEMKKLGGAPCPICGTLNSVTAKICHRCGTPLKKVVEAEPKEKVPPPPPPPAAPKAPPAAPPRAPPGAPPARPPEAAPPPPPPPVVPVPKKVVKKPIEKVVQKKVVVRKPLEKEEGKEGE